MFNPSIEKLATVREWLGTGTVNFFGLPFAGKDEQAKKLAKLFGVSMISSGEVIRNSCLSPEVRAALDRGELIPTADFKEAVMPWLGRAALLGKPLILSAVGKVSGEEAAILEATEETGHPTIAVPLLAITKAESMRRLSEEQDRGRADDTPEKLLTRFEEFRVKTEPVLQRYQEMGLLLTINAMPEMDAVFISIFDALYERAIAA